MQLYTDTDKAIDRWYAVFAESKQRKADYILGWKQTGKTKKKRENKSSERFIYDGKWKWKCILKSSE